MVVPRTMTTRMKITSEATKSIHNRITPCSDGGSSVVVYFIDYVYPRIEEYFLVVFVVACIVFIVVI